MQDPVITLNFRVEKFLYFEICMWQCLKVGGGGGLYLKKVIVEPPTSVP